MSVLLRGCSEALTEDEQNSYTETLFESIKHINEYGNEFWYARELQNALEYTEWRNFSKVIDKAITACENSENAVSDHFVEVNKIVFLVQLVMICNRFVSDGVEMSPIDFKALQIVTTLIIFL